LKAFAPSGVQQRNFGTQKEHPMNAFLFREVSKRIRTTALLSCFLLLLDHTARAEDILLFSEPCTVCQGPFVEAYRLDRNLANALPQWDLNKQRAGPPVSAEEAVQLAADHFRATSKDFIGHMASEVRLISYPQIDGRNALYGTPMYLVHLFGIFAAPNYPHLEKHFLVLPDKTVLEPKTEPAPQPKK
jgi:hypothetical protein